MTSTEGTGQLALVPSVIPRKRAKPKSAPLEAAPTDAVVRVAVDTGLAHLDRPFDYVVPTALDDATVAGCRVKVRFAGRLVDGFVIARVAESEHGGKLALLSKVVSPEPVLHPEVLALSRDIADRYAGTLGDVLRLAIPPRHARTEAVVRERADSELPDRRDDSWDAYAHGRDFLEALSHGDNPRAWWSAIPVVDPAHTVATAVLATLQSDRGAVVCVPNVRDVAHWDDVFSEVLGSGRHVVLTAAMPAATRYRSFLAASRGDVQVVLGTRAAAFAPVRDLGLVAMWDDGDDLYGEPRAPYPHAREVLLMRAVQQKVAVLIGGYARTAEGQSLVESGWCHELVATPERRRASWPRLEVTTGSSAGAAPVRLPPEVFKAIRACDGPVLIQVPRRGYRSSLSCQQCRQPARCAKCQGPLGQASAGSSLACQWCNTVDSSWACPNCGDTQLRSPAVGQLRTAEEFARAFREVEVVTSGGETVMDEIPRGRTLVLATPGAEPRVDGGYDLVVLMDTWLMLGREDVRVEEEAHRRWFNALALAGPGASAIAVGDPATLQALVRADPVGFSARELASRSETHLPPTARLATVTGPDDVLAELATRAWTAHTEILGPVAIDSRDHEGGERLILRSPRREGTTLAAALKKYASERSAAKLPPVRIQVDPLTL